MCFVNFVSSLLPYLYLFFTLLLFSYLFTLLSRSKNKNFFKYFFCFYLFCFKYVLPLSPCYIFLFLPDYFFKKLFLFTLFSTFFGKKLVSIFEKISVEGTEDNICDVVDSTYSAWIRLRSRHQHASAEEMVRSSRSRFLGKIDFTVSVSRVPKSGEIFECISPQKPANAEEIALFPVARRISGGRLGGLDRTHADTSNSVPCSRMQKKCAVLVVSNSSVVQSNYLSRPSRPQAVGHSICSSLHLAKVCQSLCLCLARSPRVRRQAPGWDWEL